jgi:hypothetical protein
MPSCPTCEYLPLLHETTPFRGSRLRIEHVQHGAKHGIPTYTLPLTSISSQRPVHTCWLPDAGTRSQLSVTCLPNSKFSARIHCLLFEFQKMIATRAYPNNQFYSHTRGVFYVQPSSTTPQIPGLLFAVFMMQFAAVTPAISTGAFVERVRFPAYLLFISLWLLAVYCPIAHWLWSPAGFLNSVFPQASICPPIIYHAL